ncbi:hypothetical protein B566_EDAN013370 [Ephemera danica]|nr:hypothetical protein B566_EDAN013370 [Ephemera danica]
MEGEQRTMIENITSLGYRKEKVKEALEAACYNPKNAVLLLKFLKNAFPDKTLDPPASALDDPTKPAAIPEALSKAVAKPAKGYERSKVKTVLVDLLKAALTNSAMSQLISEYREKMECMLQSD